MSLLRPDFRFHEAIEITPKFLSKAGITGILVDIDNTIVPWRGETPSEDIRNWLHVLTEAGIGVAIFSNAGGPRAERMSKKLGVPVIAPARKPLKTGYRRGLETLKMANEHVAAVGDQIFMDVLGGNHSGLTTILVEPVSRQEFVMTKLLRQIEKLVRKPL
jgi:uncharacterized protein